MDDRETWRDGDEILIAEGLTKKYRQADGSEFSLFCEKLVLRRGELVVITGRSGSGKSTLLQLLGLLMTPDSGKLRLLGEDVSSANANQAAALRADHLGIMFQSFNLLPQLTAEQNVSLAMPGPYAKARQAAVAGLREVGLEQRTGSLPGDLSGGEQQRVAYARATINSPDLLLADEPTGNLDRANEERMMALFGAWRDSGRSVLIVSHSDLVTESADRVLMMADGVVASESRTGH